MIRNIDKRAIKILCIFLEFPKTASEIFCSDYAQLFKYAVLIDYDKFFLVQKILVLTEEGDFPSALWQSLPDWQATLDSYEDLPLTFKEREKECWRLFKRTQPWE